MEGKAESKPSFSSDFKSEKKAYPVSASDYKLLEEIGKGVSAVVYRAKCIPFNELVAIKTLDLERCNSSLDDIRREAQTMSLISHPNVVKANCSFVVNRTLWVVMPFMEGGSCLHIMKAAFPDGFEEPIIASFLKETLKALEYLHHHGYIHRDVKAGNILVGGNGAIKLGDFGVSAFMFDTGDRQRSRSTFVGTPCWMAPEVLEQVNGYDFKADVWSFGITALELAHGHAPFSKYPPMKVLLMTLQNAPPGLDYERDKRFSKAFKEMVAMCLVKDPSKRPSAEKLLKHSFFKHSRSVDYVARTILDPLPPLWERFHDVQVKDEARLAQKKMPYGEQEVRSQNEYKRGVSSWNFDLEDLKAQADLNGADPPSGKEGHFVANVRKDGDNVEVNGASSSPPCVAQENGNYQQPGVIYFAKAESGTDAGECVMRMRPGILPAPIPSKPSNDPKSVHPLIGKKEPKHFGRFDVFDDDPEQDIPSNAKKDLQQQHKEEEKYTVGKEEDQKNRKERDTHDEKEQSADLKQAEERLCEQDHQHQGCSSVSTVECLDDSQDDRVTPSTAKMLEDDAGIPQPSKPKSSSGPLTSSGMALEGWSSNGASGLSRPVGEHKAQKESSEEKLKSQAVFQKKGRFSVTSQDSDMQEASNARKNVSVQTSMQPSVLHKSASFGDRLLERKIAASPPASSQPPPMSVCSTGVLNVSTAILQLQNLFNQTTVQQELIASLMNSINPSEQPTAHRPSGLGTGSAGSAGSAARNTVSSSVESMLEPSTERERDLLGQVAELQCRVTMLVEELQAVKLRNVQLERQLNAIYNKEEEERIRREEAARDDG